MVLYFDCDGGNMTDYLSTCKELGPQLSECVSSSRSHMCFRDHEGNSLGRNINELNREISTMRIHIKLLSLSYSHRLFGPAMVSSHVLFSLGVPPHDLATWTSAY